MVHGGVEGPHTVTNRKQTRRHSLLAYSTLDASPPSVTTPATLMRYLEYIIQLLYALCHSHDDAIQTTSTHSQNSPGRTRLRTHHTRLLQNAQPYQQPWSFGVRTCSALQERWLLEANCRATRNLTDKLNRMRRCNDCWTCHTV
jgi:hypothetical protein